MVRSFAAAAARSGTPGLSRPGSAAWSVSRSGKTWGARARQWRVGWQHFSQIAAAASSAGRFCIRTGHQQFADLGTVQAQI